MRAALALAAILLLAACGDPAPREKKVVYDPKTRELVYPYPCPDWSRTGNNNYGNVKHSNFGCATETNLGAQLETPADLHRGHGDRGPDAETTVRVIERYRAGEIPEPLTPQQDVSE